MKIIFLDIDGVLNHDRFYHERFENRYVDGAIEYPYSEIDPSSVKNLNQLISDTNAKIVISSTWRHDGIDYCKKVLEFHGFVGDIIDITPTIRNNDCLRGNEIHKWIKENESLIGSHYNFTEYVILDDDSDMLYWQRNNFILVDRSVGLYLHGVRLKRWLTQRRSDFDIVSPYFILPEGEIMGKEIEYNGSLKSSNDFDEVFFIDDVKVDLRIDPKQRYEIIKYKDFNFKVSNLFTILEAKLKYAKLPKGEKHAKDIVEMITSRPKKILSNLKEDFTF